MKIKLTRVLCGILCAAYAFTCSVYAQESVTDTASQNTVSTQETNKKNGLRYDPEASYPVFSGYTPDLSVYSNGMYALFLEILQLYTDTHLYEFTSESAKEAFLMKLFKENPELMPMFLETLLTTMDPFSGYYEAGYGLASDGSVGGYGIVMGTEENGNIMSMGLTEPGLYITDVIKGSTAEQAGILPGDRIASVEGISLTGLPFDGASLLLRSLPFIPEEKFDAEGNSLGIPNEPEFVITDETSGKKSYYLHLEVERNGEIIPIKMLKGRVVYSDIMYERAPDKSFSKIEISSFNGDNVVEDFKAALERAKKESRGNLLIDLRNNTGGKIDAAIEMANMLITEKDRILCYFNSRAHEKPEAVLSKGGGYEFDKITILVNENSASAAELLAMTLSYNSAATLVGTTTYGKAIGQQGYTFANGDMFTITSMELLDPLKRSYHEKGIVPDIEIGECMKKYEFPKDTAEFMFVPNSTIENKEPKEGEGDTLPAMEFTVGEESENILALEKRLAILDFISHEYADGKVDDVTIAAIKAYGIYTSGEPTDKISEEQAKLLNSMSERFRNYYYKYDSAYEVAKMTFSSNSQAKRKAKELLNDSKKVEKEYDAFIKAEEERMKAEEKAEEERLAAEEKAQQESAENSALSQETADTEQ